MRTQECNAYRENNLVLIFHTVYRSEINDISRLRPHNGWPYRVITVIQWLSPASHFTPRSSWFFFFGWAGASIVWFISLLSERSCPNSCLWHVDSLLPGPVSDQEVTTPVTRGPCYIWWNRTIQFWSLSDIPSFRNPLVFMCQTMAAFPWWLSWL
jgi:hypothetical protein